VRLRGISIILAGWLLLNSCEKSVEMVDCVAVETNYLKHLIFKSNNYPIEQ